MLLLSLEDLCIDFIYENIDRYIKIKESDRNSRIYEFADPNVWLGREHSEKLLTKFVKNNSLNDSYLSIFTGKNTRLHSVKLLNCNVTKKGFQVLKQHKIVALECWNLPNLTVKNALDCLSEWSVLNMTKFVFSHFSPPSNCKFDAGSSSAHQLSSLKNVRLLKLAHIDLSSLQLLKMCENLKQLQELDIASTSLRNMNPLALIGERLVSLDISDLHHTQDYLQTLDHLKQLQHLNISISMQVTSDAVQTVSDLLSHTEYFLNLRSLDVSGWGDFIPLKLLFDYLETHRDLEFLGLVHTSAAHCPRFCDEMHPQRFYNLSIAGLASEEQIKLSLQKYKEKKYYIQMALKQLPIVTNCSSDATKLELLQLILEIMAMYITSCEIQTDAMVCLQALIKYQFLTSLESSIFRTCIKRILNAMERFPTQRKLQTVAVMIISKDYVLDIIITNHLRYAGLILIAFSSKVAGGSEFFKKMSLKVLATLTFSMDHDGRVKLAKSHTETCQDFIKSIFDLIQQRLRIELVDHTLMLALMLLWNLTDECVANCEEFVDHGGIKLYLKLLRTFKNDENLETHVLGLLGNVSEVPHLRPAIFNDTTLMDNLKCCLQSHDVNVSYFAAEIYAQLGSDEALCWTRHQCTKDTMLQELEQAIYRWELPAKELAAYRSFKSFYPMLQTETDWQIQLLAVWSIRLACTVDPAKYYEILRKEDGYTFLHKLVSSPECHPKVRTISSVILEGVPNRLLLHMK